MYVIFGYDVTYLVLVFYFVCEASVFPGFFHSIYKYHASVACKIEKWADRNMSKLVNILVNDEQAVSLTWKM